MSGALLLNAETFVSLHSPSGVMSQLREHFGEHGTISGADGFWSVAFEIGKATATLRDGGIAFRVEASDDTSLSFLQWSVAEHVCEFAPGETPRIIWRGGTIPGEPLPYFREMRVVRATQLTPRMRRLTLAGRDLARFARHGMHVRLLLPLQGGVRPVWPVMAVDGRPAWPAGPRPVARVYTIRRIDVSAGEIDIDFVLHEGDETPGATFALEAAPGDIVGMTGPGGGDVPDADWYLLAGDETALPAIARILEELPAGKCVVARVEVADPGEEQELSTRADLDLQWLHRNGEAAGETAPLTDAVRAVPLPSGEKTVFVWAGCEYRAFKEIRAYLRKERGLSRDRHLVAAYWRAGVRGEIEEE
jgi:NADPH-dependent ferric siderophore reductase